MSVWCTYDNPNTYRRERWHKGTMYAFVTAQLLMEADYLRALEPWKTGRTVGDSRHIDEYATLWDITPGI